MHSGKKKQAQADLQQLLASAIEDQNAAKFQVAEKSFAAIVKVLTQNPKLVEENVSLSMAYLFHVLHAPQYFQQAIQLLTTIIAKLTDPEKLKSLYFTRGQIYGLQSRYYEYEVALGRESEINAKFIEADIKAKADFEKADKTLATEFSEILGLLTRLLRSRKVLRARSPQIEDKLKAITFMQIYQHATWAFSMDKGYKLLQALIVSTREAQDKEDKKDEYKELARQLGEELYNRQLKISFILTHGCFYDEDLLRKRGAFLSQLSELTRGSDSNTLEIKALETLNQAIFYRTSAKNYFVRMMHQLRHEKFDPAREDLLLTMDLYQDAASLDENQSKMAVTALYSCHEKLQLPDFANLDENTRNALQGWTQALKQQPYNGSLILERAAVFANLPGFEVAADLNYTLALFIAKTGLVENLNFGLKEILIQDLAFIESYKSKLIKLGMLEKAKAAYDRGLFKAAFLEKLLFKEGMNPEEENGEAGEARKDAELTEESLAQIRARQNELLANFIVDDPVSFSQWRAYFDLVAERFSKELILQGDLKKQANPKEAVESYHALACSLNPSYAELLKVRSTLPLLKRLMASVEEDLNQGKFEAAVKTNESIIQSLKKYPSLMKQDPSLARAYLIQTLNNPQCFEANSQVLNDLVDKFPDTGTSAYRALLLLRAQLYALMGLYKKHGPKAYVNQEMAARYQAEGDFDLLTLRTLLQELDEGEAHAQELKELQKWESCLASLPILFELASTLRSRSEKMCEKLNALTALQFYQHSFWDFKVHAYNTQLSSLESSSKQLEALAEQEKEQRQAELNTSKEAAVKLNNQVVELMELALAKACFFDYTLLGSGGMAKSQLSLLLSQNPNVNQYKIEAEQLLSLAIYYHKSRQTYFQRANHRHTHNQAGALEDFIAAMELQNIEVINEEELRATFHRLDQSLTAYLPEDNSLESPLCIELQELSQKIKAKPLASSLWLQRGDYYSKAPNLRYKAISAYTAAGFLILQGFDKAAAVNLPGIILRQIDCYEQYCSDYIVMGFLLRAKEIHENLMMKLELLANAQAKNIYLSQECKKGSEKKLASAEPKLTHDYLEDLRGEFKVALQAVSNGQADLESLKHLANSCYALKLILAGDAAKLNKEPDYPAFYEAAYQLCPEFKALLNPEQPKKKKKKPKSITKNAKAAAASGENTEKAVASSTAAIFATGASIAEPVVVEPTQAKSALTEEELRALTEAEILTEKARAAIRQQEEEEARIANELEKERKAEEKRKRQAEQAKEQAEKAEQKRKEQERYQAKARERELTTQLAKLAKKEAEPKVFGDEEEKEGPSESSAKQQKVRPSKKALLDEHTAEVDAYFTDNNIAADFEIPELPFYVMRAFELCRKYGAPGTAVFGGGPRDLMLKLPIWDFDMVTEANPQVVINVISELEAEISQKLGKAPKAAKDLYKKHLTINTLGQEIETYTAHFSDGNSLDFRINPLLKTQTFAEAITADARRRNATVNAFYMNHKRQIVAPDKRSLDDLKSKTYRMIAIPSLSFYKDPTLILLSIAQETDLDFTWDDKILKTLKSRLPNLVEYIHHSAEHASHINSILIKVLIKSKDKAKENNVKKYEKLEAHGVLAALFPELANAFKALPLLQEWVKAELSEVKHIWKPSINYVYALFIEGIVEYRSLQNPNLSFEEHRKNILTLQDPANTLLRVNFSYFSPERVEEFFKGNGRGRAGVRERLEKFKFARQVEVQEAASSKRFTCLPPPGFPARSSTREVSDLRSQSLWRPEQQTARGISPSLVQTAGTTNLQPK